MKDTQNHNLQPFKWSYSWINTLASVLWWCNLMKRRLCMLWPYSHAADSAAVIHAADGVYTASSSASPLVWMCALVLPSFLFCRVAWPHLPRPQHRHRVVRQFDIVFPWTSFLHWKEKILNLCFIHPGSFQAICPNSSLFSLGLTVRLILTLLTENTHSFRLPSATCWGRSLTLNVVLVSVHLCSTSATLTTTETWMSVTQVMRCCCSRHFLTL